MQALELISKFVVVYSEAMENGRVEVAYVYRVLHNVVAIVVGLAIRDSGTHASPRQPSSETARMMVTAIILLAQPALAVHSPAKLASSNDQSVIE